MKRRITVYVKLWDLVFGPVTARQKDSFEYHMRCQLGDHGLENTHLALDLFRSNSGHLMGCVVAFEIEGARDKVNLITSSIYGMSYTMGKDPLTPRDIEIVVESSDPSEDDVYYWIKNLDPLDADTLWGEQASGVIEDFFA